jgi:thiamine-phosphate pyrophosphorylase
MNLSKLHYISQGNSPEEHLVNIQNACSSGAELVQLHLKNVSVATYLKFAKEAREITSHFQTRLILIDHYKIAKAIKADGVHLEKTDFCPTIAMEHLFTWQIIGSTANTLQECEVLINKKVDYIILSPFKSKLKEENSPTVLGVNGCTAILEALKTETPIIAFGEITQLDVKDLLATGISGIGVSEEITRNFNSIKTFNKLLNTSSTDELRHTFE